MLLRNRWQFLLATIFLAFLSFSYWSIQQAYSRVSPVADPDYYAAGQSYYLAERAWRAAAEAGWSAWLAREGEYWRLRLEDGGGAAVSGGAVIIKALRPGGAAAADWHLALEEIAPGIYQAAAASLPTASAELLLSVSRGEARLERRFQAVSDAWAEIRL